MARKIIIGEILNLIKGLGGNPNKFMGTRSNINFLGKGPQENLFQSAIDIEGMVKSGFPIQKVISEAESAGGYVTAGKLNDLQLQRLKDNLISLKKAYFPEQIPNITDLGTGTRDLTQEGIASLREGQRRFPAESHQFMGRPLTDADFAKIDQLVAEGKLPRGSEGQEPITNITARISDRMKKIQEISDEMGAMGKGEPGIQTEAIGETTFGILDPTAEKASYASRFNPRNEVHVNKAKALLEDPQIKGLYTEAEVKNAYDFEGLYQSHFDKGHVDVAQLLEQAGHNIPQMRASARDALLDLMKKQKGTPGAETGLRDFVDEIDFKFISEGGGGRAGDPINLFVKYFGKKAAENLPKTSTKENINAFTDFIINAKDRRGRGIDDPFFDRESINFSEFTTQRPYGLGTDDIPFKTGGRVGFKYGSRTIAKGALAILNRNKKNAEYMFKASDNVSPSYAAGDMKYNAELLADQLAEDAGVVYDDLADLDRIKFYGAAYDYLAKEMGMIRQMQKDVKNMVQIDALKKWDPTGRKPNASGGLAKILEV